MDVGAIILAFEASTGSASVAVMATEAAASATAAAGGGKILAGLRHDGGHGQGHGGHILPLAARCLDEAGVGPDRIDTVLAGRGPGSFTGVRVALAAAKGLMVARGAAGYGIGSLTALGLAAQARENGKASPLAVLADTRRKGLVYLQCFDADGMTGGAQIEEYDAARRIIAEAGIKKIIGNVELPGLAANHAEPLASHLCHAFLAAGNKEAMPLEPIYLTEPLLGPPPQ